FAAEAESTDPRDPQRVVRDALEQQAPAPRTPPTLPDSASDRARYVHENIAFGKKGAAERAAHSRSGDTAEQKAAERASDARNDAAERAARGAGASAAKAAKAAEKAAAGLARSEEARGHRGTSNDMPANPLPHR